MSAAPALSLLGLLLLLLAIPFALCLAPLILGTVILAYGLRIAHVGLASPATPA